MKNVISFCKQNAWKISTFIFIFLFLSKGCTHNKINNLGKKSEAVEAKLDSLQKVVDAAASAKEVRDEMEKVMLDYLIYEDDLDKGKTSISSIKNKIESND
jgi:peptidoglycan hydrolase CwlO-like protein